MPSKLPLLPCPTVKLDAALRGRAQRFAARLSAARGRREGAARAGLATGGLEFDHYRPYRAGDDLRALDWDVYARSDQAVVRVLRPEAGERWAILLDTSASMGVGPPGKLQRAAECALALAQLGLREEVELELVDLVRGERIRCARRTHAAGVADWLEKRAARGVLEPAGLRAALGAQRAADRAFLLSDLVEVRAALDGVRASVGTRWTWIGILAPLELAPGELGAVRWLDAESAQEVALEVDPESLAAYGRTLEGAHEQLVRATAPRGIVLARGSSAEDFEDLLARALRA